jgi:DNA-binding transcriptional LysR family regulator
LGVGHLPQPLAAPEIAAGRLVVKRTTEATPDLPLHVAWRGDHEGLALSWFLERLGDETLRARLLGEAPPQKKTTRAGRRPSR